MKILYVFLVSFLLMGNVLAQPNSANRNIVVPTTASIGVNWDPKVALYSGAANMSVPLYQINDYQYSLPINLTYSYSGLRYNDYASIVGLHWSLSIPVISRNIVDKDDFNSEKGYCFVAPSNRNKDKTDMPDVFTLHSPEGTVKFFFPQGNVGASEIRGELLYDENGIFTINYNKNSKVIIVSSIKGNVYQFDTFVNTKCQIKTQPNSTNVPDEYYISSWYPSKIVLSNKKEISFQYSSSGQKLYSHTGQFGEVLYVFNGATQSVFASESFMYSDELLLNKITWNNGNIYFRYEDRDDLEVAGSSKAKRVVGFEVYNSLNEPVKITRFQQDYFLNQNGTSKRLRLTGILEYGNTMDNAPEKYTFQYDPNRLPDYSFLFKTFGYDSVRMNSAALMSVSYPTGLMSKYEYEPNDYNPNGTNASTPHIKHLGVRVKSISQYNRKNELIGKKNYGYKSPSNTTSSGLVLSRLSSSVYSNIGGVYFFYLSNNWYPPVYQSEIIGYGTVWEYSSHPEDSNLLNGAKRTDFMNDPVTYGYDFMGATARYNYVNGRVYNECSYSGTKMEDLNLVSIRYYTTLRTDKDYSINMFYTYPLSSTVITGYNTIRTQRAKVETANTRTESLESASENALEEIEFVYPPTTTNDYRDFLPLKKNIRFGGVIQKIISYKYPYSLLTGGATHTIAKLAESINGDKTMVIEELVRNKDGNIVSGTLNDFKQDATSGVFVPLATYLLDLESPLPSATLTASLVSNSSAWQINPNYKKYIDYIHNNQGYLLQISDRTKNTLTYIWGYNNLYPIAEVQNASYADVEAVLGATSLADLNIASVSETTVKAAMVKLRTDSRMKKTQILTYVHAPLIGMREKIDFRGISESYVMDGFNRLIAVKDEDGNVLKNYIYNQYSGQIVASKFYNREQSKTFTKNDCPPQTYPNFVSGTSVTYTVAAGKYTSSISQEDADLKAIDEINTSGQAHANKYGTCNYGVIIEW